MKTLSILTLGLGLMFAPGCSQETQEKAGDAATATGDAVKSAAEDVKDAAADTVDATKEAAEDVKEKIEGDAPAEGTEN